MIDLNCNRVTALAKRCKNTLPLEWAGGWPVYYLTEYKTIYCAKCGRSEWRSRKDREPKEVPVDYVIFWDGASVECSICGKVIESAFGVEDAVS